MAQEPSQESVWESLAGRVVVGCDGSAQSADAAGWAAQRAVARGQGLTVLVATGRPDDAELGVLLTDGRTDKLAEVRKRRVKALTDDLRERNPGLDVTVVAVADRSAQALVAASPHADPLVIGTRGLGRLSGHLLGAVADQVVTHGTGTIVVVPTRVWHVPGQQEDDIVVGYDYSPASHAAMDCAFAEAKASGLQVRVVHALELGELWDLKPLDILGPADPLVEHMARLEAAIAPWRQAHPEVTMVPVVRQGASASALLADESADASLLVVGHRGLGGFKGLLLGSTVRRLLHHARCPVAVVRAQR